MSERIPEGWKKVKYENCFVAFLDILGFKDKVFETKKDDKLLDTLIKSLRINQYFTQSNKKEVGNNTKKKKIEIRSYFFSDSFVFMMKENKEDLVHLFLIIRYLQDRFWENDLCFRGAITKGKMYWPKSNKENIILGPAMIKAYKLESQIAIYPRIIISKSLLNYINNENISAWPIGNRGKKLKQFIKKDKDGVYFFDILHPEVIRKKGEDVKQINSNFSIDWNRSMEDNYKNILRQVEEIVEKGIKNQDEKKKQKYEWLKSYLEESRRE